MVQSTHLSATFGGISETVNDFLEQSVNAPFFSVRSVYLSSLLVLLVDLSAALREGSVTSSASFGAVGEFAAYFLLRS